MKTKDERASSIWTRAKGLALLKVFLRPEARGNLTKSILPYWISAIHEILKSSNTCDCEHACWLQRFTDEEKLNWVKTHWCKELDFEAFWREVSAMYLTAVYFKKVRNCLKQSLPN